MDGRRGKVGKGRVVGMVFSSIHSSVKCALWLILIEVSSEV